MSHWEHGRTRIFNQGQHPFKHSLSDFSFSDARLPGATNVEDALTYIVNVLYPDYIGTFATPADLPVSPAANSYAFVVDDGDGKSAGYIFQSLDGAGTWMKRYDVDWSLEGILAENVTRTQALFVQKYGNDDKDGSGTVVTGALAGQHIYGGATAGNHLTLHANSGDATGRSGFIQVDDSIRPTADIALDLGDATHRFLNAWIQVLTIASLSSTGNIDVGGNLLATGTVLGSNLSGTNTGDLTLSAIGSTPNANGLTLTNQVLNLQPADGSFGGIVSTTTQTFAGNKTFSGTVAINGAGTGLAVAADATVGGTLVVTGTIGGSNLSGTNTGDLTLAAVGAVPNANGASLTNQVLTLQPADSTTPGLITAGTQTLGGDKTLTGILTLSHAATALSVTNDATVGGDLTLSGSLITGAATFVASELQSLRNVKFRDAARTQAAQLGDALFYDSVSGTWLASSPDTEITHSGLTGLTTTDAGHTQFVMLAGRSAGQTVYGGTAASENLTLGSTANASKGTIQLSDTTTPVTDASYSGSWSGTDLGDATHYFRDIYAQGVFKGLRLENYTSSTLPTASASKAGRLAYTTDDKQIYVDTGGAWVKVGVRRFMSDTSWDGSTITKTVTVSSTISDARMAVWGIHDNADNYARIYCKISAISATQVQIDVETPLPAGSYRLIGLE